MRVATENSTDRYASDFAQFLKQRAKDAPLLTPRRRKAAMARFVELGFPTTRDEEWRFTNLGSLAETRFRLSDRVGAPSGLASEPDMAAYRIGEASAPCLVFLNGFRADAICEIGALPEGVEARGLASADPKRQLEPHLARYANDQEQTFTALNTAFCEDGAYLHIAPGTIVKEPIHLLFVTVSGEVPTVNHPRCLIVVEENAEVSIIESYVGYGTGPTFTNAVTEIVVGENATVDHYKLNREQPETFHIGALRIQQDRDSNVTSHAITLGGGLTRNEVDVALDGEGAHCTLNGLYLMDDQRHVDNHLRVEHIKPHCNSWEYFKGILEDQSSAVFTGRIIVHEDAQKTNAKQTNMNLLLSADARIDTKPQLEIFADDVKCTHGATIGQIDEEAIFYLKTRGVPEQSARSLLVRAFAGESIAQIKIPALRQLLDNLVIARLPGGELLGALA